ncbi:MAG: YbjN domain-containing protein [Acidobacteria bacterium]|nr:YbjN domain-containing protein [Acidobacteriota bacterium]
MQKRYLTFLCGFAVLALASSSLAQEPVTLKQLQGYLDKMALKYVVHPKNDNALVVTTAENEAAERLDLYIEIRKDQTVVLTAYAKSKGRYFNLARVAEKEKLLQRLLEENYASFTTFYLDKQGDIGVRFTFTTEDGLGYESFSSGVNEVLRIADQFTPKLDEYMQKPAPATAPDGKLEKPVKPDKEKKDNGDKHNEKIINAAPAAYEFRVCVG